MLKNLGLRLILSLVIISSVFAIYHQVNIIRSAQASLNQLEAKVHRLEVRNQALEQALK